MEVPEDLPDEPALVPSSLDLCRYPLVMAVASMGRAILSATAFESTSLPRG